MVQSQICSTKISFIMFCHYWQKMSIYPLVAKSQHFSTRLVKYIIPLFIYVSGWERRWIPLGFWNQLHFLMKWVFLIARNRRVSHTVLTVTVCPWLLWVSEGEIMGVGMGYGFLPCSRNLAWMALGCNVPGQCECWAESSCCVLEEALPHGRAAFCLA